MANQHQIIGTLMVFHDLIDLLIERNLGKQKRKLLKRLMLKLFGALAIKSMYGSLMFEVAYDDI